MKYAVREDERHRPTDGRAEQQAWCPNKPPHMWDAHPRYTGVTEVGNVRRLRRTGRGSLEIPPLQPLLEDCCVRAGFAAPIVSSQPGIVGSTASSAAAAS
jgi:hypothetical protein